MNLKSDKANISVKIQTFENASKVFSPARFSEMNFLKKRHFQKIKKNGRNSFKCSGRAAVVVEKSTPLLFEYNMKQQKLTTTFYVQRYDREDFLLVLHLHALINKI
jgi:hypothetical protein